MKKVEDVKKNKKKQEIIDELSNSDDYKLSQRIIDLCLWYQIEDSRNMIKLFDSQIKMYETKKQALLNSCIFAFQKRKIEKELEEIDNKIYKLYEDISKEVSMISKMEESISRDETSEYKNSDRLVSYYELLSLLKMGIIYERVILHKFDDTMTYIFDGDNYIIEDENDVDDRFEMFLSDCDEVKELMPWYATMYVKKEYRKKGYSKILNDAILKEAKNRDIKALYLKTDLENYYDKFGAVFIKKLESGERLYKFELDK